MEREEETNKDRLFEQVEKRPRGRRRELMLLISPKVLEYRENLASSLLNELATKRGKIRKKKRQAGVVLF